jgi:hypothetical protein
MIKKGSSVTNNSKDGDEYKEYTRNTFWCEKDDIWISIETPLNKK